MTSETEQQRFTCRDHLTEVMESSCKPPHQWRIGIEHEKFVFRLENRAPAPYHGPQGIKTLLQHFAEKGWEPISEQRMLIGLRGRNCGISIEPGGQLELEGTPFGDIHAIRRETRSHFRELCSIAESLGLGILGMGYHPTCTSRQMPVMPKKRYHVLGKNFIGGKSLGREMMFATCAVQVSLDFSSPSDMVRKFRLGVQLQPLATVLFANSPFTNGCPNGFLSYRAHVWSRTRPFSRCASPMFALEKDMSFARYVDYALSLPLLYVQRKDRFIRTDGVFFTDFLAGRLPQLPGERPTIKDWHNHLTTLYPDIRLKNFLEMRGADTVSQEGLCAAPAFWTGLLYDERAMTQAEAIVSGWGRKERRTLHAAVRTGGLRASFLGKPLAEVAGCILDICKGGLQRRARKDAKGKDESCFLRPLEKSVACAQTPAQKLLELWKGAWRQDIRHVFAECSYKPM